MPQSFLHSRANLTEVRILQITKKFPYPVIDGEVIAVNNLTKGFAQLGHQVTVLALNTNKHYFDISKLPEEVKAMATYKAVDINTDISAVKAFANLFSNESYNIERFYSPEFERLIEEELGSAQYDMVLLETIYLMRYIEVIRRSTKAKVVLRPHNVEYLIWHRLAAHEKNAAKKQYLNLLTRRMKAFELANINKADVLAPVSETDMQMFIAEGAKTRYKAFPIGYEIPKQLPQVEEENAVEFIGGMDWLPNYVGVKWFINHIWPLVVEKKPEAKFYLAGRNFPDDLKQRQDKGLVVVGEVADAKQFIASKTISVVPLLAGSGMRVKIIEAMALGRAIVSTSVGAESIAYTHNENILIADGEQHIADAVIKLLEDARLRASLGNKARELVNRVYDNSKICSAIIDFCKA
jgi:glycosyltransferase involved in cell wall biosynthesis